MAEPGTPAATLYRPPTPYVDEKGQSKGWNEVRRRGWEFKSQQRPPLSGPAAAAWASENLSKPDTSRLPCQFYADNFLSLENVESGLTLYFTCQGAFDGNSTDRQYFSTHYSGNVHIDRDKLRQALTRNRMIEAPGFGTAVSASTAIPDSKLEKAENIHFYDNVIMWRHEENGHTRSVFSVKIRVMDDNFLVLLRSFVVEAKVYRLIDTRYYGEFDSVQLLTDTMEWEVDIEEGAPHDADDIRDTLLPKRVHRKIMPVAVSLT